MMFSAIRLARFRAPPATDPVLQIPKWVCVCVDSGLELRHKEEMPMSQKHILFALAFAIAAPIMTGCGDPLGSAYNPSSGGTAANNPAPDPAPTPAPAPSPEPSPLPPGQPREIQFPGSISIALGETVSVKGVPGGDLLLKFVKIDVAECVAIGMSVSCPSSLGRKAQILAAQTGANTVAMTFNLPDNSNSAAAGVRGSIPIEKYDVIFESLAVSDTAVTVDVRACGGLCHDPVLLVPTGTPAVVEFRAGESLWGMQAGKVLSPHVKVDFIPVQQPCVTLPGIPTYCPPQITPLVTFTTSTYGTLCREDQKGAGCELFSKQVLLQPNESAMAYQTAVKIKLESIAAGAARLSFVELLDGFH
jgi:hypothetical protein